MIYSIWALPYGSGYPLVVLATSLLWATATIPNAVIPKIKVECGKTKINKENLSFEYKKLVSSNRIS